MPKFLHIITLFLAIILFHGCEQIEPGIPVDCRIGTVYQLEDNLSFVIDSIKDYRCPKDVICVWSGDVDHYFRIYYHDSEIDTTIYLYTRNNNPFEIGGFTWRILEVNPWLNVDQSVDPEEYRIKLVIEKN